MSIHQSLAQTTAIFSSGFEDGQPAFVYDKKDNSYNPAERIQDPANAKAGSFLGGVQSTGGGYDASIVTLDAFNFEPGLTYDIMLYAKGNDQAGTIELYRSAGTGYNDVIDPATSSLITTAQEVTTTGYDFEYSFKFTVLSSERKHIAFLLKKASGSGYMYLDNITIATSCDLSGAFVEYTQDLCTSSASGSLDVVGAKGQVSTWQVSENAADWVDVPGSADKTTLNYANVTATTFYRAILTSGKCQEATAAAMIGITAPPVAGTISGAGAVCFGENSGTLTLSGQTGSVTEWQQSTDDGMNWESIGNSENNTSYTYSNLTQKTLFRAWVRNGYGACSDESTEPFTVDIVEQPAVPALSSNSPVCLGSALNLTAPDGYSSYLWTGPNGFTSTEQNPGILKASSADGGDYTLVVTNSGCPNTVSATLSVAITAGTGTTTTWQGNSADWFDSSNWTECVPNEDKDAVIPMFAAGSGKLSPVIGQGRYAAVKNLDNQNALTLQDGATLELTGAVTGSGRYETNANSATVFSGNTTQQIGGYKYNKLILKGSGAKVLGGEVTVEQALDLTEGMLQLGGHDLIVSDKATIIGYSSANYIITDGTGKLQINNIGYSKSGFFPVGTPTGYTPATIENTGISDHFRVRVEEGVYADGSSGTLFSNNVVKKTWDIAEGTSGLSNVTLMLQWNKKDEASEFERISSFMGHYAGGEWVLLTDIPQSANAGAEAGSYTFSQGGITSFSSFAIGSESPLPVALLLFEATKQGQDAVLSWETATETNNQGFGIEVSTDGVNYRSIGFVASKGGDSQARQAYSFRDTEDGKARTRYYRLRQTDLGGAVDYFGPRAVTFDPVAVTKVRAWPNPFGQAVELVIEAEAQQTARVVVTDLVGREVYSQEIAVAAGANTRRIELGEGYSAGVYHLTTWIGGKSFNLKLIKQR